MDLLTLIVGSLTLLTFGMAAAAAVLYQVGRDSEEDKRLQSRLSLMGADEDLDEEELASLIRNEAEDAFRDSLGSLGDTIRLTLQQAGSQQNVSQFVLQSAGLGLIVSVLAIVFIAPSTFFLGPLVALLPWVQVRRTASARAKGLLEQLPDALELMGRAMQAGNGLSETFLLVSEEMPDPIRSDFGRIYESLRFGKDWKEVFSELIEQYPSIFDLRLFVSSLILQRDMGGNTIETVNRISKLIRQRAVFDAKVKAMSAEARMSGYVLASLPIGVSLLIFAGSPEYLSPLFVQPLGQMVSLLCFVGYTTGIFLMRSVSQISI